MTEPIEETSGALKTADTPRDSRAKCFWYVAVFAALQAVVLAGAIFVGGTQWYLSHAQDYGLRLGGYAEWAPQQNCDVVLYGDSSALMSLDPAVITQRTGLSACNVAEGVVFLEVTGSDHFLDVYLARNKTPRFIVTTWSSIDFRPQRPPLASFKPQGVSYSLQYMNRGAVRRWLTVHPYYAFEYATWIVQSFMDEVIDKLAGKRKVDVRRDRAAARGLWQFPLPAETHCLRNNTFTNTASVQRNPESVKEFRRRYTTPETQVIIDVTPVPDCDSFAQIYRERTEGLHDNAFQTVPVRFFNEGDVHMNQLGSTYYSNEVAEQILERMDPLKRPEQQGSAVNGLTGSSR